MIDEYMVSSSDRDAVQVGNVFLNLKKLKKDFNKIARKVQVQSGGFKNLFKLHSLEEKENLNAFASYMEKILKLKIYWDKQGQIAWYKCCYMIWLMKDYKFLLPFNGNLKGNSANAQFLILNTEYTDPDSIITIDKPIIIIDKPIIIKVQLDDRADDILVDSVNARLLNIIPTLNDKIDKIDKINNINIMEYISSFRAYVTESSGNYNLPIPCYIKTLESQLPKENSKKCLVAKAVNHRTLGTLMDNINSDFFRTVICPNLHTLAKTMIFLGEYYGFVHNDCHLGNILYNNKNQEFVLIDYGRVYFDLRLTANAKANDEANKFFNEEIYKLSLNPQEYQTKPNYSDHLRGIVLKNKSEHSSYYISPYMFYEYDRKQGFVFNKNVRNYFIQNMVLFDISTIVMNMLHTLADLKKRIQIQNQENIYRDILGFYDRFSFEIGHKVVSKDGYEYHNVMIIVPSPNFIKDHVKEILLDKNQAVFFLGIFMFSCLIEFLYSNLQGRSAIPQNIKYFPCYNDYEVNFTQLVNDTRIMYHAYQYARIPRANEFEYFIYSHREFIENLKTNIKTMRGGTPTTQTSTIQTPTTKKLNEIIKISLIKKRRDWEFRIPVTSEPVTSEQNIDKQNSLKEEENFTDFITFKDHKPLLSEPPDIQPKDTNWIKFVKTDLKCPSLINPEKEKFDRKNKMRD
jgi:hypothetical protein